MPLTRLETHCDFRILQFLSERNLMINEVMRLRPRDRDIMILRYGLMGQDELTQKEVADLLGISQSYISRLEKRIMLKLRRELIRQTSCV